MQITISAPGALVPARGVGRLNCRDARGPAAREQASNALLVARRKVTAREPIDPVRFLGNQSSGRRDHNGSSAKARTRDRREHESSLKALPVGVQVTARAPSNDDQVTDADARDGGGVTSPRRLESKMKKRPTTSRRAWCVTLVSPTGHATSAASSPARRPANRRAPAHGAIAVQISPA